MTDSRLEQAVRVVQVGGVLIYPTETVYGIGGDATQDAVAKRVRRLKQSTSDKPMLVLTDEWERVGSWFAHVTPEHERLMAHRPALAVTILFEASSHAPLAARGNSPYIGVRRTANSFCRTLIEQADRPLLSTSANPAGHPPPQTLEALDPELRSRVELVVEAVAPLGGVPSTVVRIADGSLHVLRPGAVPEEHLSRIITPS